jgi:hypothetical protein
MKSEKLKMQTGKMYFHFMIFHFSLKKQIRFDKENLHIALGIDARCSSDVGTEC